MRRLRRTDLLLAVVAVLAIAGLALALRPHHTPGTSGIAGADIDRPPLSAPAARPTALVISDSYTSGSGLAEASYACEAATQMGWLCKLATEPGTGYISGGTANRFPIKQGSGKSTSFGERIPILAGLYKPDVVILDGGRNDTFAPANDRFQVEASTIWQAHQTWPNARIVYIQPRFLAKPDDDLDAGPDIADRLKEASDVKDLVVVDPIIGFKDTDTKKLISSDGINPNSDGEKALASALAKVLATSGIPSAT
jgi:lysophospholipase L1-like esterase